MTANQAHEIAAARLEAFNTIALVEKLIESEAERGRFKTKVGIRQDLMRIVRDHFYSKGFGVNVTIEDQAHILNLTW